MSPYCHATLYEEIYLFFNPWFLYYCSFVQYILLHIYYVVQDEFYCLLCLNPTSGANKLLLYDESTVCSWMLEQRSARDYSWGKGQIKLVCLGDSRVNFGIELLQVGLGCNLIEMLINLCNCKVLMNVLLLQPAEWILGCRSNICMRLFEVTHEFVKRLQGRQKMRNLKSLSSKELLDYIAFIILLSMICTQWCKH